MIAASQARLAAGEDEWLTEADLDALRAAPTPLAFWRRRRARDAGDLAQRVGVAAGRLEAVERGEVTGDIHLYAKLARELGIEIEDLVPEPA